MVDEQSTKKKPQIERDSPQADALLIEVPRLLKRTQEVTKEYVEAENKVSSISGKLKVATKQRDKKNLRKKLKQAQNLVDRLKAQASELREELLAAQAVGIEIEARHSAPVTLCCKYEGLSRLFLCFVVVSVVVDLFDAASSLWALLTHTSETHGNSLGHERLGLLKCDVGSMSEVSFSEEIPMARTGFGGSSKNYVKKTVSVSSQRVGGSIFCVEAKKPELLEAVQHSSATNLSNYSDTQDSSQLLFVNQTEIEAAEISNYSKISTGIDFCWTSHDALGVEEAGVTFEETAVFCS